MLAIISTHPIQYQVPIWQMLAQRGQVPFEVWYLSDHGLRTRHDQEFGVAFQWDINLTDGYCYRFTHERPEEVDITTFRGARMDTIGHMLRQHQITALWINGWQVQAYWQAAAAAFRQSIPVWLRGDTNDLSRSNPIKRLPRWLMLQWLFRRVDSFLYVGSANRRFYESFGVAAQRLSAAPHCVDNDRFAKTAASLKPQRDTLRLRWGIPEQATCLLFSGKLIPKKRPMDLLAALRLLLQTTPAMAQKKQIHVLVVGDGELRASLTDQAHELEYLAGRPVVTFAGFLNQSEMPKAYVAADCLVLPSDAGETWGLVVNEALACGRAVVVSDQCGSAEDLARPLGDGHIYPCGDVSQLAHCLSIQVKLAGIDRQDTYAKVIANFGIEQTVTTIERLYAKTLV